MHIHFFLRKNELPDSHFSRWDPDKNPERFPTGVGHSVLELAKRMQHRGHKISLGPKVSDKPDVVIFFKGHLAQGFKTQITALVMAKKFPTIYIRSDLSPKVQPLFRADIEIVPASMMIQMNNQVFLPLLIQRGLIPSERTLESPVENVVMKCNPQNVPADIDVLKARIAEEFPLLTLRFDLSSKTDPNSNQWHNFQNIDITLILRRDNASDDELASKPPTRLINAWCANTIPIVYPVPSYLELMTEGIDGFTVRSTEDIIKVIRRLNNNPELLRLVRSSVKKKQRDYSREKIIDSWESLLLRAPIEIQLTGTRCLRIWRQALPRLFLSFIVGITRAAQIVIRRRL